MTGTGWLQFGRRVGWRAGGLLLVAATLAGCATDGAPPPQGERASASVVPAATNESEERRRARIRLELAANYYQQGNYQVALDELRQALQVDPGYAAAYGVLGLVYRDLGDLDRAQDSFLRGLQIAPGDPDLNNNYGWFLCQTGRERQSIEFFMRALKDPLYPTPAKPLHNAGICSMRVGDEAAAEGYFQRSFQVDPRNAVAMYHLGDLYLKRRELERAHFYAQRLLTTYEPNAQTLWLALRVERARGNRDGEASLGMQLRRRFPGSPEAGLLAEGKFTD